MTNLLTGLPPSDEEIEQSILETGANLRKGRDLYQQLQKASDAPKRQIDSRILDSYFDHLTPADHRCLQEYNDYINREENSELRNIQSEPSIPIADQPEHKETVKESI